jgi:hypothetical protein
MNLSKLAAPVAADSASRTKLKRVVDTIVTPRK